MARKGNFQKWRANDGKAKRASSHAALVSHMKNARKRAKRGRAQTAAVREAGPPITHAVCQAVLTADAQCRKQRRWRLLTFEEMKPLFQRVPPIGRDVRYVAPDASAVLGPVVESAEAVREALVRQFPLLPAIFALWGDNLLAAGGSVANAMRGVKLATDVDLFVFGLSEEAALERLRRMETAIPPGCSFSRTNNALQFVHNGTEYQIVMRLYVSPDHILGGFDLPCAAVGYAPSLGVVATPLGAWSFAAGVVILDSSRRSPSMAFRCVKYLRRGFAWCFPA